jgi:carboxymethylenebutenolidase
MSLHVESIVYGNGAYSGYFAFPERAQRPLPAVLVLQEAWGVDAHIEDVTRRFAYAGYAALAPDLYAKNGARPDPLARDRLAELLRFVNTEGPAVFMDPGARSAALAKLSPDAATRVEESMGTVAGGVRNFEAHVPALLAATKHLREERAETRGQKVGSVGYCMGGGLSGLLACHDPQLGVACIYYGMPPAVDLVSRIACPVYGFYGGEDKRVNDSVPPLADAMHKAAKRFVPHTYPGAQHAFFNDERPSYHAAASRDAFARTLEAFREHLGSAT